MQEEATHNSYSTQVVIRIDTIIFNTKAGRAGKILQPLKFTGTGRVGGVRYEKNFPLHLVGRAGHNCLFQPHPLHSHNSPFLLYRPAYYQYLNIP